MFGAGVHGHLSQAFPPKPRFTEKELPDLGGKVYIVTGSNTGVGKDLAQILYGKNATVYIAARTKDKALSAIEDIKKQHPSSTGKLTFLRLDLADLTTIKATVEEFLAQESRLHVLFNNAGVMAPAKGSKSAQGYELQLGVNNIGTLLLTKLLTPTLVETAKSETEGTVRVVWVSSSAAEHLSHKPGGVPLDKLDTYDEFAKANSQMHLYGVSKAGNYLHAVEFAKQHRDAGIVSVALNPGNLDSDLYRERNAMTRWVLRHSVLHPAVNGAYTELFAGLSPDVTMQHSGDWVVPWGRFMKIRPDLESAVKSEAEGGSGGARKFWEWTEAQYKQYV